ncbi:tetratricopeptide repeat protein [Sphingomonas sp. RS6]
MAAALVAIAAAAAPAAAQADLTDYVLARAADSAGSPLLAAQGYARALAAAPNDQVVAMRAYREGLEAGDTALALRAERVLRRAGVAPPDAALLVLADAVKRKDAAGADDAVERLRRGPLDFLAPVVDAWLVQDRGGDGAAALDQAEPRALARRYTARHRALLLIADGRTDAGLAALRALDASAYEPDDRIDAASLLDRRDARRLLGRDREARALLKQIGKRRDADAAFGVSRAFMALADDLSGEDVPTLSITLTRSALLLDPNADRARLDLARALGHIGAQGLALATLAAVDPDGPFARRALAGEVSLFADAGDLATALAGARSLAEDKRATADDLQTYADLLSRTGDDMGAARAYADAMARGGDHGNWTLHFRRGTALDRAGRWDEALPELREAARLAPDQPELLRYLGDAQIAHGGDPTVAEALLERARRLAPKDPAIASALGWTYYRQGHYARAVPLLESAARGEPAGIEANERLGDTYWQLGRRFEARYAWRAAATMADNDAAERIARKLDSGLATVNP